MVGGEEHIYYYGKFDLSEYLEEEQVQSVLVSPSPQVYLLQEDTRRPSHHLHSDDYAGRRGERAQAVQEDLVQVWREPGETPVL